MADYRIRRISGAFHTWPVLAGWAIAFVLAVALAAPAPEIRSAALHTGDTNGLSAPFATSEQAAAEFSSHDALASHMHFEHHQLVRAENAVIFPITDSARACYLTCVIPLASLDPYPLQEPPRA